MLLISYSLFTTFPSFKNTTQGVFSQPNLHTSLSDLYISTQHSLAFSAYSLYICSILVRYSRYAASMALYAPSSDVIAQVKDRGIDIGFIEGSYSGADIECIPMGSSYLHFVASPELIGKNVIKKDDLCNYNMFFIHRKCSLRRIIEENLATSEIDRKLLKISIESPSLESIKASVIAGQGISILPYLCIKKELYSKSLVIFEVENVKFPYSYSLIYKKKNVKHIKTEFINYMERVGKEKLC